MDDLRVFPYFWRATQNTPPLSLPWEGPGPSIHGKNHQAPNIEHHPKGMHISGCSTTTFINTPRRQRVGRHVRLRRVRKAKPPKKIQSIGIDLLLEGNFFGGVVVFLHSLCQSISIFGNLLYLQIDGRISTPPTSKFLGKQKSPSDAPSKNSSWLLTCDQIRDRYCRSTMTALVFAGDSWWRLSRWDSQAKHQAESRHFPIEPRKKPGPTFH